MPTEETLSALAHDLLTPISVIAGYAELLERRSGEGATREAASNIKAAAAQLRSIIDAMVRDARAQ